MASRTQKSVNLFRDLADVWLKIMVTAVLLLVYAGAIVALIIKVVQESPWQNNIILGAVDLMLSYSIPTMVRHFFPKRDSQD
ncbi:hypothetical protein [Flavobacterium sp. AG291]|uniref:hypothetical protein n=1 Tax=Flavobacterium sp. AG291 TaxID=2184000 RepID=UPI000E0BB44B|nr:hypothetical protein [Flavobacterium sp. AG291]RDI13200.1 hypothetical protein DEU42_103110 [Flavobacterium sp. AG291]